MTPITVVFPEDAPLVFVDGQPRPDHRCGVLFGDSPCNTGECCGEEGFCGTSTQHCSGGCQTPFGRCDSTSAVIPGTTYPREDNRCGPDFGNARCHYGECCSKFGHCGKLTDHCDADFCDTKFGQCAFPVNGLSAVVPITVVHEAFTPTLTSVQVVAPTLTSTKVLTTSVVTVVTQTLAQDIPVASQQLADTTVTSSVVNVAVTQTVSTAGIASTVVQDQPLTQEEELIKACPMEFGTDAFFDCKHLFYQNHAAATFDPVTDCSTVAIASETIAANLPEATQAVQLEVSNEDAEEEEALEEEEEATADELAQEDEELFEGEGPSERELVEAQAQSYSGDATKVSQAPLLTLVLAVAGLMLM